MRYIVGLFALASLSIAACSGGGGRCATKPHSIARRIPAVPNADTDRDVQPDTRAYSHACSSQDRFHIRTRAQRDIPHGR